MFRYAIAEGWCAKRTVGMPACPHTSRPTQSLLRRNEQDQNLSVLPQLEASG